MTDTSHNTKRILLIESNDEEREALKAGLKEYKAEWEVIPAANGDAALREMHFNDFDLVIAEPESPRLTNPHLLERLRTISPQTKLLFLSHRKADEIDDTLGSLPVRTYLVKPIPISKICHTIEKLLAEGTQEMDKDFTDMPAMIHRKIINQLKFLNDQIGAECTLLVSSTGNLVAQAGMVNSVDLHSIAALVAANFSAMAEVARLLGNAKSFKSVFQGGEVFNVYSHRLNDDFILVVIAGSAVKTGLIWFYTRQVSKTLQPILSKVYSDTAPLELDPQSLQASLDSSWEAEGENPEAELPNESSAQAKNLSNQTDSDTTLLSWDEAVQQGILESDFLGKLP